MKRKKGNSSRMLPTCATYLSAETEGESVLISTSERGGTSTSKIGFTLTPF